MDPQPKNVQLSSGYMMPEIGLGLRQVDDLNTVKTALQTALEVGYRRFDTDFAYKNEKFIGSVLHDAFQKGVVKREEIFMASQLPTNGMKPEAVEYFLKYSLENLQMDYLDLYLIHLPVPTKRADDDFENINLPCNQPFLASLIGKRVVGNVDIMDTWKAMELLVDKGLVRSIGLSNFNSVQLERILKESRIKPCILQIECHAYLPQYELVEFCKQRNVTVTAYAPLGTPGLPGFIKKEFHVVEIKRDVLLEEPKLKCLSEKHKKTPAQILLRFLIQREITVIPKSSNPERIKENFEVFDFVLNDDDMNVLKSMAKNYRYFRYDCLKGIREHPEYPFNIPF